MATRSFVAITGIALLLALSVFAVYVIANVPANGSCQGGGCTTLSGGTTLSVQAGNRTVVATYSPPTPDTTTTVSNTLPPYSTGTSSSSGTYTYAHNSQVDVLSVSAVVSGGQHVTFSVQFQNIGSGTMLVAQGGGSAFEVSLPSSSGVLTEVQGPRCMIATALVPVGPGDVHTSTAPGCWSGYSYRLVAPGTVHVQLTLTWSSEAGANQSGSLVISAEFALS